MTKKRYNKLPDKHNDFVKFFKPKNKSQEEFVKLIENNEIVIATGISGSGKTITALATALSLLGDIYKKIILVKSVVTIPGEAIGFIPGKFEEKMEPFIMSYTWNIDKILTQGSAKELIDKELIEILPLAYIRGLSIDNSIIIVDESQNLDLHTFKTLVTRIGENSKYIFLGDIEQVDRKNKNESCLNKISNIFNDNTIIKTIEFKDSDCVRHPIIIKILKRLRENGI